MLEQLKQLFADDHRFEGDITIEQLAVNRSNDLTAKEVADDCMMRLGYRGIGDQWKRLTAEMFCEQLSRALQVSLAYSAPMLSTHDADEITARIVAMTQGSAICWLAHGTQRGWTPVSTSTFDLCFVAVADDMAIVVVFEDED